MNSVCGVGKPQRASDVTRDASTPSFVERQKPRGSFLRRISNRYWLKGFDQVVVLLPLVRKLLIIRRPKDGDITDRINEKAFGPDRQLGADRRQQFLIRPLVDMLKRRARWKERKAVRRSDDKPIGLPFHDETAAIAYPHSGRRHQIEMVHAFLPN
jgi:hypothetical protein